MSDGTPATIVAFQGSWTSGIASLIVQHDDGTQVTLMADSGPLGRALGAAFDSVGEGHTIRNEAISGKRIVYYMDDMGLLLKGFSIPEEG
jgi:hypothetical protein